MIAEVNLFLMETNLTSERSANPFAFIKQLTHFVVL